MGRYKITRVKGTVAEAVNEAYSDLESLAEEVREVVDNASGTPRENTQRIQTLDESASTLEGLSEPTIDDSIGKLELEYARTTPSSTRKGLSRADRRDGATGILNDVIEFLKTKSDEWSEGKEEENPYDELIDELDNIKGEAECAEFPGMYG